MSSFRVLGPVTPLGAMIAMAGCADGNFQSWTNANRHCVLGTSPLRFNCVEHHCGNVGTNDDSNDIRSRDLRVVSRVKRVNSD
jgi:hypothetical protein